MVENRGFKSASQRQIAHFYLLPTSEINRILNMNRKDSCTRLRALDYKKNKQGSGLRSQPVENTVWAHSSVGQSSGLIIRWSQVRVLLGPPSA